MDNVHHVRFEGVDIIIFHQIQFSLNTDLGNPPGYILENNVVHSTVGLVWTPGESIIT